MIEILAFVAVLAQGTTSTQKPGSDPLIERLFAASPVLAEARSKAEEYKLQLLVSEIVIDANGGTTLVRHGFRVDAEYTYPASAIKLFGAISALEKLNDLRTKHADLTITTPLVFHPLFEGEKLEDKDDSNLDARTITLRHEIRKLFLVSDNAAFNRLFEFVGPKELQKRAWDEGYESLRVLHRLSEPRSEAENLKTPRIDLKLASGVVTIPERTSDLSADNGRKPGLKIGSGVFQDGKITPGPMNFTKKNGVSLVDLQDALVMLAQPELGAKTTKKKPFHLEPEQVEFLLATMAEYPAQSVNPRYSKAQYGDDWGKYVLPGLARVVPKERLSIHNKVGQAYGFTIENAYVFDTQSKRAFFVTATIYTNANGILNDGVYEYDTVALPFYAALGEALANALLL